MKVNIEDLPQSKTPTITYCRKLIQEGYGPNTKLEVFRENKPHPDVLVKSIGLAAKYTVAEGVHQGPRFVKMKNVDWGSLSKKKDKLEVTV